MMGAGGSDDGEATTGVDWPTTDDAFLGGLLHILQPKLGYRAGVDTVLLAAACHVRDVKTARILDLGAGVGTAGLCVARRVEGAKVVLADKSKEALQLANANIKRNGLSGRVSAILLDISAPSSHLAAAGLNDESFSHVIANPPYHARQHGTSSRVGMKDDAHAMDVDDLDCWFRFMARMVVPRGIVTIVHKADALDIVLAGFKGRFGAIKILPITPRSGAAAHRILVTGVKGSGATLTLLAPFVLHGEGHGFSHRAEQVLRHGEGLDIDAMIC